MQENPYATPLTLEPSITPEPLNSNQCGPSLPLFRGVLGLSLWCYLVSISLPQLEVFSYSQEMSDAMQWNYYEAILPLWSIRIYTTVIDICSLVGMFGLLFFWRASRWLLAIAVLLSFLSVPLMGLSVSTPFEPMLGHFSALGMIWLVTVSFWSPIAARFRTVTYVAGEST